MPDFKKFFNRITQSIIGGKKKEQAPTQELAPTPRIKKDIKISCKNAPKIKREIKREPIQAKPQEHLQEPQLQEPKKQVPPGQSRQWWANWQKKEKAVEISQARLAKQTATAKQQPLYQRFYEKFIKGTVKETTSETRSKKTYRNEL